MMYGHISTEVSQNMREKRKHKKIKRLRDKFAMAALTGIADQLPYSIDNRKELVRNLAIGAYQIADAMLEAREAK